MDSKYQLREMTRDLQTKDVRIKQLEKEQQDILNLVHSLEKKVRIALEGLSHIDNPIARETEREIDEV